jgi:hypothetical protein
MLASVMAHVHSPASWALYFLNTITISPELKSTCWPHCTRRYRAGAHQRNWQLQWNRNFQEMLPISIMQLVSRLAGTHRENVCLISCSHHLKWVCSSNLISDWIFLILCTSLLQYHNNTDNVIMWWWLRRHKKRGQGKIKHWVCLFFHDSLNSCAFIVSKELNHDSGSFIS